MPPRITIGRFPVQSIGAFIPWRGAKEVSGVALVVAQEVPTSSIMAVPHGPSAVGVARHRMREDLRMSGVADSVIDDAVLILSELLSNACRHGRPLSPDDRRNSSNGNGNGSGDGTILAAWRVDELGWLTVEVTDGGGPTRPLPATPSVTARGGRGLNIIRALSQEWGVRDASGEVTVWAALSARESFATRVALGPSGGPASGPAGSTRGAPMPSIAAMPAAFADIDELR
ncbi:ATP-binding protein [Streptomyces sp. NPDC057654]|uniref:ATP-binding protein n=1 Tax=Streptomyces sp. NPDC057654 TaxID=3346196 RepID=UPI0036769C4D